MYESINEDVLPQALMIGVAYDLFWTLTPKSLEPFIKAFELKIEMEQTNNDINAWQSGVYIQLAIGSLIDKDTEYPKEPFSSREGNSEVEPMSETEKLKEIMMERMAIVNSQLEREGETIDESE